MMPSPSPPRPFVDYLVAREGVPPRSGLAFDYILAADGLFVTTESDLLAVRLPVAPCRLRGDRIAPVAAACELRMVACHARSGPPAWRTPRPRPGRAARSPSSSPTARTVARASATA